MPEEILVNDHVQRRFQYRITVAARSRTTAGCIDVIDLDDETCVVVYSTDADPRAMALTIGGATAARSTSCGGRWNPTSTEATG